MSSTGSTPAHVVCTVCTRTQRHPIPGNHSSRKSELGPDRRVAGRYPNPSIIAWGVWGHRVSRAHTSRAFILNPNLHAQRASQSIRSVAFPTARPKEPPLKPPAPALAAPASTPMRLNIGHARGNTRAIANVANLATPALPCNHKYIQLLSDRGREGPRGYGVPGFVASQGSDGFYRDGNSKNAGIIAIELV